MKKKLVDLLNGGPAHGGPANARVEDVEIRNEKFTDEFSKFDVLYYTNF